MAYDPVLADRIRALVADDLDVTEKKMFGGLAFLVGGHMSVAAVGDGAIMARVDREDNDLLLERIGVEQMVMQGRTMTGWLTVAAEQLDDDTLREWVDRSTDFARSLPPKEPAAAE